MLLLHCCRIAVTRTAGPSSCAGNYPNPASFIQNSQCEPLKCGVWGERFEPRNRFAKALRRLDHSFLCVSSWMLTLDVEFPFRHTWVLASAVVLLTEDMVLSLSLCVCVRACARVCVCCLRRARRAYAECVHLVRTYSVLCICNIYIAAYIQFHIHILHAYYSEQVSLDGRPSCRRALAERCGDGSAVDAN